MVTITEVAKQQDPRDDEAGARPRAGATLRRVRPRTQRVPVPAELRAGDRARARRYGGRRGRLRRADRRAQRSAGERRDHRLRRGPARRAGSRSTIPNPIWPDETSRAVQRVLDEEINPAVGTHGGFVTLLDVRDDVVYIRARRRLPGMRHGRRHAASRGSRCGFAKRCRQIRQIVDTTDHAGGSNPVLPACEGRAGGIAVRTMSRSSDPPASPAPSLRSATRRRDRSAPPGRAARLTLGARAPDLHLRPRTTAVRARVARGAGCETLGADVTCLDLAVEPLGRRGVSSAAPIWWRSSCPCTPRPGSRSGMIARIRALDPVGAYRLLRTLRRDERGDPPATRRRRTMRGRRVRGRGSRGPGGTHRVGGAARGGVTQSSNWTASSLDRLPFARAGPTATCPRLERYAHVHDRDGWHPARTALRRGEPWLQAPLPALPGRARSTADRFRVVPREVVLEDVATPGRGRRRCTSPSAIQTSGTASATRSRSCARCTPEHPRAQLRRHDQDRAPAAVTASTSRRWRDTGCLFVTSAVESLDDRRAGAARQGPHARTDFLRPRSR